MLNESPLTREDATSPMPITAHEPEQGGPRAKPPRWPGSLDFYGQGTLLLSRSLRSRESWEATTPSFATDTRDVQVRLIGAASGDGILRLQFEREEVPGFAQDSVFDEESARLELANVIAGRLLEHSSPWGDDWEWCSPPQSLAGRPGVRPMDGFAVEYAFQTFKGASVRWWITASLERLSAAASMPAQPGATSLQHRQEQPCST